MASRTQESAAAQSIFPRGAASRTFALPSCKFANHPLERRMTSMAALWLPIVLSSVLVFVASAIIHMASPWHKSDCPKLANEDQVMDALRPLLTAPGDYMVPRPSDMAEMKSAEFRAKAERGPRVIMTVMPNGPIGMSREFTLRGVYLLVVNVLVAYVAAHALLPGAPFARQDKEIVMSRVDGCIAAAPASYCD